MGYFKTTLVSDKSYNFLQDKKPVDENLASSIKTGIERDISSQGLIFRIADISDIEKIFAFQKEIFHPHTATLESEYELYRIIKFGYALLIENEENKILGCYTTIHYLSKDKEGYGIRVGVSPEIAGYNFAAKLARYATVLAFENGCKNFNVLMSPTNFRSASNVLNHVGYYCINFHRHLPSFGTRFEISLPLTFETLSDTEVNIDKVVNFVRTQVINKDYLLLEPHEIDRMESTYLSTEFKIIAFLKKGAVDNNDYFFAIKPQNNQ